jgi:hypothetical protein
MQTVYILSGKNGEMKNEKRNDMGVGVYGCMPSSGGWEKKCAHTRKNNVPGVGAMGYGFSRYFRQKLK